MNGFISVNGLWWGGGFDVILLRVITAHPNNHIIMYDTELKAREDKYCRIVKWYLKSICTGSSSKTFIYT